MSEQHRHINWTHKISPEAREKMLRMQQGLVRIAECSVDFEKMVTDLVVTTKTHGNGNLNTPVSGT